MKIGMIGKGAWGLAIGDVLKRNGHEVLFVGREEKVFSKNFHPDYLFLALPCQVARARLIELQVPSVPIVSLTKGIEIGTGLRVTEMLDAILPNTPHATLSGPSFAKEVQELKPTAVVAASADATLAREVQSLLHQKLFRVYRSTDLVGVELGGALKNIYAIAGGICHGLHMGNNGMAGLLTRCLAEIIRIGVMMGARKETLFGLSGMGDLVLTSYSGLSRNHQIGEALAQGMNTDQAIAHVKGIAEGIPTTRALKAIVQERKIKAPVLIEVYNVLYENKSPREAFNDLMLREAEEE